MQLRSFGLAVAFVLQALSIPSAIAEEKDLFPESNSEWNSLEGFRKTYEERYAKIVDTNSFREHLGSRRLAGEVAVRFLKNHCQDPAPKNPRCAVAKKIAAETPTVLPAILEQSFAIPGVDFDELEPFVFDFERKKMIDSAKADALFEELSKRKVEYWTNKLQKIDGKHSSFSVGGRDDDTLCLFFGAKPKDSAAGLAYAVKGTAKTWLQCSFPTPPAKLKRDDPDYWELEVDFLDGYTRDLGLMFNVASPSKTNLWSVAVPTDAMVQRIKAATGRIDREVVGNWAYVKVKYVTRKKDGKKWSGGKWVDSWNVNVLGRASFYFRWR